MNSASIVVNGVQLKGRNISVNDSGIFIDGRRVDVASGPKVDIQVQGNVDVLDVGYASSIVVNGNAGKIQSRAGDIKCGDVTGNVSAGSGDLTCGIIGGSASTGSGDISCEVLHGDASTLSGGINVKRPRN